jgi:hypothetical protein
MYTVFELDKHRNVVSSERCFKLVTARFIAGCYVGRGLGTTRGFRDLATRTGRGVDGNSTRTRTRTYQRQLSQRGEHVVLLVPGLPEILHRLVSTAYERGSVPLATGSSRGAERDARRRTEQQREALKDSVACRAAEMTAELKPKLKPKL